MTQRRRHIPLRTCVACRTQRDKRELLRVVRTVDGHVRPDLTGKANGRGAYLCRSLSCIALAERRRILDRHLDVSVSSSVFEELRDLVETAHAA